MASSSTTEPGPLLELLGRVAYELQLMRPLIPTYLALLVSAIFPIYTASHSSLLRPPSAIPPPRRRRGKSLDHEEETDQKIESLTPSDALMFPILAGTTLATLYFILKWLQDPAWLNWILSIYYSYAGLFLMVKFFKDTLTVLRSIVLPRSFSAKGEIWIADPKQASFKTQSGLQVTSPLPGVFRLLPIPRNLRGAIWNLYRFLYAKADMQFHLHRLVTVKSNADVLDLLSLLLSSSIMYYHTFVAKPWFLTNLIGFSFCYGSLQYISPTTAWTGTLILSALFFYDIYFVFFTPMMVTVATKLDLPIKLLFPRPSGCVQPIGAPEGSAAMEEYFECLLKKRAMAMLGLGDIVVPGIVLGFALRFDLFLNYLRLSHDAKRVHASRQASTKSKKPVYLPATGNWGERFWTSPKLQSSGLRAKAFPKTYFHASVFGYIVGLVLTLVAMQITQRAQPALLYLVPCVLLSLWGTALVKGEIKTLWEYSEMPEDESEDNKKKMDKKETAASDDSKQQNHSTGEVPSPEDKSKLKGSEQNKPAHTSDAKIQDSVSELDAAERPKSPQSRTRADKKSVQHLFYFQLGLPQLDQFEAQQGLFLDKELLKIEASPNLDEKAELGKEEGKEEFQSTIDPANILSTARRSTRRDSNVTDRANGEPPEKRRRRG